MNCRKIYQAILLSFLLAACSTSEPTRFYTLSATKAVSPAQSAGSARPLSVGLGPILLPEYLNRPEIVTRDGTNRVVLAELHKWIEPLEDMVPRLLARNLSALLASPRIFTIPRRRQIDALYEVEVEILRFDAAADGAVRLDARWRIFATESGAIATAGLINTQNVIANSGDYAQMAAAMSDLLLELSRRLADDLRRIHAAS